MSTCSEPLVWTCKSCGHSFHEEEWNSGGRKCPVCDKNLGSWKCSLCQEVLKQPALGLTHPCYRGDSSPLLAKSETQPRLSRNTRRAPNRTHIFFLIGFGLLLVTIGGSLHFWKNGSTKLADSNSSHSIREKDTETPLPAYEFATYENPLFSFRVSYPFPLLSPKGDVKDPAGARFISSDGGISLIVYGNENAPPLTMAQVLAKEASTFENPTREIQSKQEGADSFELRVREGDQGILLKQILRNEKWRKLRLQYPWSKASQLGEILDKVAVSFAATDPVIERPKMYFFYHPDLKRIYESEFFDGDEKIGVPPDSGPFVYQPSESSVRISNMNRNRVFGNTYGGVFFDGKVVPGEIYVFRNDFLTGSWRRLSTEDALSLLRQSGISPPKTLRKPTGRQAGRSPVEPEAPENNLRVS